MDKPLTENNEILIVDDSEFDRNLLSSLLLKKGFKARTCNDGTTCLEQVKSSKPSLILLDVMMPDIQGNEVLKRLRTKYNSVELPIIMITAKSEASDIVDCLKTGANDYITKPINFDIAHMRILTHLKISEFSKQMGLLKEMEAISAMIATYNHEINNPLSIAIGSIKSIQENPTEVTFKRLNDALWRIADIVKKIDGVTKNNSIQYENYSEKTKLIKIK